MLYKCILQVSKTNLNSSAGNHDILRLQNIYIIDIFKYL